MEKEYFTNIDPALNTLNYIVTEFDCGVDGEGALRDLMVELDRLYAIERQMKGGQRGAA